MDGYSCIWQHFVICLVALKGRSRDMFSCGENNTAVQTWFPRKPLVIKSAVNIHNTEQWFQRRRMKLLLTCCEHILTVCACVFWDKFLTTSSLHVHVCFLSFAQRDTEVEIVPNNTKTKQKQTHESLKTETGGLMLFYTPALNSNKPKQIWCEKAWQPVLDNSLSR